MKYITRKNISIAVAWFAQQECDSLHTLLFVPKACTVSNFPPPLETVLTLGYPLPVQLKIIIQ